MKEINGLKNIDLTVTGKNKRISNAISNIFFGSVLHRTLNLFSGHHFLNKGNAARTGASAQVKNTQTIQIVIKKESTKMEVNEKPVSGLLTNIKTAAAVSSAGPLMSKTGGKKVEELFIQNPIQSPEGEIIKEDHKSLNVKASAESKKKFITSDGEPAAQTATANSKQIIIPGYEESKSAPVMDARTQEHVKETSDHIILTKKNPVEAASGQGKEHLPTTELKSMKAEIRTPEETGQKQILQENQTRTGEPVNRKTTASQPVAADPSQLLQPSAKTDTRTEKTEVPSFMRQETVNQATPETGTRTSEHEKSMDKNVPVREGISRTAAPGEMILKKDKVAATPGQPTQPKTGAKPDLPVRLGKSPESSPRAAENPVKQKISNTMTESKSPAQTIHKSDENPMVKKAVSGSHREQPSAENPQPKTVRKAPEGTIQFETKRDAVRNTVPTGMPAGSEKSSTVAKTMDAPVRETVRVTVTQSREKTTETLTRPAIAVDPKPVTKEPIGKTPVSDRGKENSVVSKNQKTDEPKPMPDTVKHSSTDETKHGKVVREELKVADTTPEKNIRVKERMVTRESEPVRPQVKENIGGTAETRQQDRPVEAPVSKTPPVKSETAPHIRQQDNVQVSSTATKLQESDPKSVLRESQNKISGADPVRLVRDTEKPVHDTPPKTEFRKEPEPVIQTKSGFKTVPDIRQQETVQVSQPAEKDQQNNAKPAQHETERKPSGAESLRFVNSAAKQVSAAEPKTDVRTENVIPNSEVEKPAQTVKVNDDPPQRRSVRREPVEIKVQEEIRKEHPVHVNREEKQPATQPKIRQMSRPQEMLVKNAGEVTEKPKVEHSDLPWKTQHVEQKHTVQNPEQVKPGSEIKNPGSGKNIPAQQTVSGSENVKENLKFNSEVLKSADTKSFVREDEVSITKERHQEDVIKESGTSKEQNPGEKNYKPAMAPRTDSEPKPEKPVSGESVIHQTLSHTSKSAVAQKTAEQNTVKQEMKAAAESLSFGDDLNKELEGTTSEFKEESHESSRDEKHQTDHFAFQRTSRTAEHQVRHTNEPVPVRYANMIDQIREIISQRQHYRNQQPQQTTFKIDDGPLGKMEISFSGKEAGNSVTILVESESAKAELQKFLPLIQQGLQDKGIDLTGLQINVSDFRDKQNKETTQQSTHSKYSNESGKEDYEENIAHHEAKRNYGYNTMEVIA